jgi:NAD(P)H-hydrate repair Nnr-like enzyme with NAD(P)H-hydrate dehydratase domain
VSTPDPLEAAGNLAEAVRGMSDLLTGAVSTLVAEGWTEEQARTLVVAMFVQGTRQALR